MSFCSEKRGASAPFFGRNLGATSHSFALFSGGTGTEWHRVEWLKYRC